MNSRVHPKYRTRYRVTNWTAYDRALVQRGDLTIWMSLEAIKTWDAMATGRRGAPHKDSDLAIETALTVQLLFHLPLRQAEGFLRSLFELMGLGLDVPDHTTLSRKGSSLKVNLGVLQSKKPMHLVIDSTGLSIVGEGEWAVAKHGGGGKRGWRKLHIGVDADGCIQTQVLTKSNGDDATTGVKIVKKTKGKLSRVTGDAAYDTVGFYGAAKSRGGTGGRSADCQGIGHWTRTTVGRTGPNDPPSGEAGSQGMEESGGLPSARNCRERVLSV